jgi:menaquinone-dependent protoporphyrinogen oxidase
MYKKGHSPRVLVVVASRHGGTHGIAEAIAVELRMGDLDVELWDVDDVTCVGGYDAVIMGSAVYMGRVLPAARAFVDEHASELTRIPVWLFSSGPIGDEPKQQSEAAEIEQLVVATKARQHKVFAGKLDKHTLGLGERLAVKVVGAPEGDFRDWQAIRAWSRRIAKELTPATV